MVRHLAGGSHDEYFWPILAYLCAALLALVAMIRPGRIDARRWFWCAPFLGLTVIGLLCAYWLSG